MLNKPTRSLKDQSDIDWGSEALGDLLAGIQLNQRLVETGVWDQLVTNMTTDSEVSAYGTFLIGLRESYRMAKLVRGDK